MLYDPKRSFIFVHIWKTGGESVVSALKSVCPIYFNNRWINKAIRMTFPTSARLLGWRADLVSGQHLTLAQIQDVMPEQAFEESFKFTFVRNPWDWQVSNYFYALQTKAHGEHQVISQLGSFEAYIRYKHAQKAPPQSSFLYDRNDQRAIDFVGRFESFESDFRQICEIIGVDAKLPHLNASRRKRDWRHYYTSETMQLVEDTFRSDLEEFGYSWDHD